MRVHASVGEDARLWISAALAATVVYALIVAVGVAPAPFGRPTLVRSHDTPSVVRAQGAPLGLDRLRRQTATRVDAPNRGRPVRGASRAHAQPTRGPQPQSGAASRPTAPAGPSRTPTTPGNSSGATSTVSAPSGAATPQPPTESADPPPSLPPVNVPPADDVTSALPPLPVTVPPVTVPSVTVP